MQILLRCFKYSRYTRFLLPSLHQTRSTKKYNHDKGKALCMHYICNNKIILRKQFHQFHEIKMFKRHARRL